MAKKNKKKKQDGAVKTVGNNIRQGDKLSQELGFNDPLSRISTDIPDDQRRYMEALMAMSDPSSGAYVGQRTEEEKSGLSYLENLMKTAGERSADRQGMLDRAKNQMATAGQRSSEMAEILQLMKGGLAGLNAQENQALREQAQREVDRKRQAAIEQVQSAARMGGMRGGAKNAGMRTANRDAMMAQANMEQKNLLANIDIQDKRRTGYANTLGDTENAEFDRGNRALSTYGTLLGDTERDEFDRKNTSANSYNNRLGDLRNSEFDRVDSTMGRYGDSLTARNNYFLDASKINMGQERTERAAKITGSTGLAGLVEAEKQRRRDARKNRGDGRDRASSSNQQKQEGGYDPMSYYNELQSIYKNNEAI